MNFIKPLVIFSIFFLFTVFNLPNKSYASTVCPDNDISCVINALDTSDYVKFTKSESEYGLTIEEDEIYVETYNNNTNSSTWFLHQIPENAKYYVKGKLTLFRGFKADPENSIFKTLLSQYPDLRNKDLSPLLGKDFECIFSNKDELKDFLANGLNEKYVTDGSLINELEKIENIKSDSWRPIDHTVVKKPAIYLYPTADNSSISVSIDPNGKITKTIPDYNGKWIVNVAKSGQIDKKYDYLFYEADLNESFTPTEGWVVDYNDLSLFFDKFLPILGLNKKESTQFKQYWLRELKRANYYLISPVSKEFIENNLKLDVTPVPDTVIRVILYFSPLDNPINIPTPVLEKPKRTGFTVVEWGGILGNKTK